MRKVITTLIIGVMCTGITLGQALLNNGSFIHIGSDVTVKVISSVSNNSGGLINNNGTFIIDDNFVNNSTSQGGGTYKLGGDWENNNIFNADTSDVMLEGASQSIKGVSSTSFYDLILSNSGIKTLELDATVINTLELNDRELATGVNTMFITTTSPTAITRTSGFVSSDIDGSLSRMTASNVPYLFPTGSSIGTARYRPVEITPLTSSNNTFAVRLANNNADLDGYDRSLTDNKVCDANPEYYHWMNRAVGSDMADIGIFYNPILEGDWMGIAQWDSEWKSTTNASTITGTPLYNITTFAHDDFNTTPFILKLDCDDNTAIEIYNTFTPNGDGANDTWHIDNIEDYPNNTVRIMNRWGDVVYEAAPYNNEWDGTRNGKELPEGTYYYLLDRHDGFEAYQGILTIIR